MKKGREYCIDFRDLQLAHMPSRFSIRKKRLYALNTLNSFANVLSPDEC